MFLQLWAARTHRRQWGDRNSEGTLEAETKANEVPAVASDDGGTLEEEMKANEVPATTDIREEAGETEGSSFAAMDTGMDDGSRSLHGTEYDENAPPRKRRYTCCTHAGCTNISRLKGKCFKHGGVYVLDAIRCTKHARFKGLCVAHGGVHPFSYPSCTSISRSKGKCVKHGGGVQCSHPGCEKRAQLTGLCRKHGGFTICSQPRCANQAILKDKCRRHGGGKQ